MGSVDAVAAAAAGHQLTIRHPMLDKENEMKCKNCSLGISDTLVYHELKNVVKALSTIAFSKVTLLYKMRNVMVHIS